MGFRVLSLELGLWGLEFSVDGVWVLLKKLSLNRVHVDIAKLRVLSHSESKSPVCRCTSSNVYQTKVSEVLN